MMRGMLPPSEPYASGRPRSRRARRLQTRPNQTIGGCRCTDGHRSDGRVRPAQSGAGARGSAPPACNHGTGRWLRVPHDKHTRKTEREQHTTHQEFRGDCQVCQEGTTSHLGSKGRKRS